MIGYYNYTVILTYIGTMFGFTGIICAMGGQFRWALLCLMMAGFCDMFDGKIASTMKRTTAEKRFGIQIDSMSDLICFGVLPAFILVSISGGSLLHLVIAAGYMLCALIRLAWFNVDEEERQDRELGNRETYLGLPVTTSALLVPGVAGLLGLLKIPAALVMPWLLVAIAAAFLTPFHMKKPHTVGKIVMMLLGIGCMVLVLLGVQG